MQQRETAAIPKLVLSTQDRLLRQIVISKPRLTIGRRPYNDIMLDDLTVSGEHAVLHTTAGESVVHDLKSRNGTLVNGEPVMQRVLVDGDRIEIGIYRLRYVLERLPGDPESPAADEPFGLAEVKVLSGASAGTTVRLERAITSIGSGAAQVAVVARRRSGYHITHLEGPTYPLVNGESIGLIAHPLAHEDLIELAGTIFQFRLDPRV
jgi:pSer/pThr/pTyr-binding forkhead associated (FHA) protein